MLHIHMVCFLGACDGLIRDIDVIHEMLSMQTTCTTCKHVLNLPQEVYHEKAFLSIHLSNVNVLYVTSNTRFNASNYSNISVGSMFHDHISNLQTMCTSCKHLLMNSGRKNLPQELLRESIHISNVMSWYWYMIMCVVDIKHLMQVHVTTVAIFL